MAAVGHNGLGGIRCVDAMKSQAARLFTQLTACLAAADYAKGELGLLLDGHLPHGCDLSTAVSSRMRGFRHEPRRADRVHAMVILVPCESATDEEYLARLRCFKQEAMDRGELHVSAAGL